MYVDFVGLLRYSLRNTSKNIGLLVLALCLLFGCSRQPQQNTEESPEGKTTIEISVFEGGFGLDYFLQVARDYEKLHPDVKVNKKEQIFLNSSPQ